MGWVEIRYAFRALMRTRGVAFGAVIALAFGIAISTTMFSLVDAGLYRSVPFPNPDRLVILYTTRTTPQDGLRRSRWSFTNIKLLEKTVAEEAARAQAASFEATASFSSANASISGGPAGTAAAPEQVDGEIVSPAYFRLLKVVPIAGRTFLPEEDAVPGGHPVALIGERLWHTRFSSSPAFPGASVRINDMPLTIVGILPEGFAGASGKASFWIPRMMAPVLTYSDYLITPQHFISVIGRLRYGVSLGKANAELAAIGSQFADRDSPSEVRWGAMALSIDEARIDPTIRRSAPLLLAASVFVLLIACVNIASVLLARARGRRGEIAVRLSLGASRGGIIRQLLIEAAVLAAAAGAAGTTMSVWFVKLLARSHPAITASGRNDYGAISAFAAPAIDLRVIFFALAATLLTTFLFGLAPAIHATRTELVAGLRENDRAGSSSRSFGALIVAEAALAVLLVACAGLLLQSFARLQTLRGGFAADGVLTFRIQPPNTHYAPADGPVIIERLLTRIEQLPGVESAAVNRCTPFLGCAGTTVFFPGGSTDPKAAPVVGRHYVSSDYFRTLGIPLMAGRVLTPADRADRPRVAVVNESAARKFWPGENPIGKLVWFGSGTGFADQAHAVEIVGIAGDVKYGDADRAADADFYTSYLQFSYPDSMFMVKTRVPGGSLVPSIRSAVAGVDDSLPIYDVMTLNDRVDGALARPRFNAAIVAIFAAAALLLAALGVYGVLSYAVSVRKREIGIRLALGANPSRVVRLIMREGLLLAGAGAAIGFVASLAAARLIQGMLFGAAAVDFRSLIASATIMIAFAGAAAFLPAHRAGKVDPSLTLRGE